MTCMKEIDEDDWKAASADRASGKTDERRDHGLRRRLQRLPGKGPEVIPDAPES